MATSTLQIFSQSLDRHLVKARNIINVIVIIVFSLMVLVVFAQVVWRFLFNNPFPWSEELARYLQVWLILLASVACLRKGNHLAVDLFSQVSSFPIARGLKVVSIACILLFTAILFFASLHLIGTTFNEAELARIKAICAANNVLVCSDEIHADLVFSPQSHQPFMQDELGQQIGIGLFAPSKTFNIPGLGCSYAIIANPVLRKQYQQAAAGIVPWVNLLGYIACEAAYQYGEPWLEALLAYLKANRDYLFAELTSLPGIDVIKPEATYLMWFKLPESKQDAWAHFLAHGLAFSNGADFGQQGYLRWNYACSRKLLEQGVNQFKHALPLLGCADKR